MFFLLGYVEHIIKKWDVANFGDFIVIEASIIGMIFIITKWHDDPAMSGGLEDYFPLNTCHFRVCCLRYFTQVHPVVFFGWLSIIPVFFLGYITLHLESPWISMNLPDPRGPPLKPIVVAPWTVRSASPSRDSSCLRRLRSLFGT